MESLIDYSRQAEFNRAFEGQMTGFNHAIIGCGGVGFWLAIILAMQGYQNFALFDGQILETTNMNRIPVPPNWLGIKKVTALRKVIRSLRPETSIVNFPNHITPENLDILGKMIREAGMPFIIWDCTDDARIQRKVFEWSRHNNITYRKIGYEGFTVGSYKNYDVWTSEDYQPGYRTSNACAASSAFAAVMGFMAEGFNIAGDINLDIRNILAAGQKPVETAPIPQPVQITGFDNVMVDEAEADDDEDEVLSEINTVGVPQAQVAITEAGAIDSETLAHLQRRHDEERAHRRMRDLSMIREALPDPIWINPATLPTATWGETTTTNND